MGLSPRRPLKSSSWPRFGGKPERTVPLAPDPALQGVRSGLVHHSDRGQAEARHSTQVQSGRRRRRPIQGNSPGGRKRLGRQAERGGVK